MASPNFDQASGVSEALTEERKPFLGGEMVNESQPLFAIIRNGVLAFYIAKLGQATRRGGGTDSSYKR